MATAEVDPPAVERQALSGVGRKRVELGDRTVLGRGAAPALHALREAGFSGGRRLLETSVGLGLPLGGRCGRSRSMGRQALARLADDASEDADVEVAHSRGSDGTGSAAAAATAADNGSGCVSTNRHPMLSAAAVLTIG
ncbi:MAG TPA: hypothetical protein VGW75_09345 [Solirubrobacteraceae bacterium]|nr:hypothetical protein [Solirubrobacteraceae bacterium]